jgi:hypothetical protein
MRERTILASFYSEAEADRAAQKIHDLGVEVAQVDQLRAFAGPMPARKAFPISGQIPSLSSLTLNTEVPSRDWGVLLAVDPSASGMADGQDNITGRNYLLTVICPEDKVEECVRIIKECNGYT